MPMDLNSRHVNDDLVAVVSRGALRSPSHEPVQNLSENQVRFVLSLFLKNHLKKFATKTTLL